MKRLTTVCPRCEGAIDVPLRDPVQTNPCPHCNTRIVSHVFPALLRPAKAAVRPEASVLTDESTCYNHPAKRAVALCESCGRFVCSLCEVPAHGNQAGQCVSCFEQSLQKSGKDPASSKRLYMDEVAITLALLGVLIFYLSIFIVPMVTYLIVRYWRTPLSAAPRSRWRFVVAGLLLVVQLLETCGVLAAILLPMLWA